MASKKFAGLYTALITPFDDKNKIDYKALTKVVANQIKANVAGLVILGTTGESPTISDAERVELFKFIKKEVGKKMQLILGTGSNSTEHTIELTRQAEKLGADAALVVNPYYNKPTQAGLYLHFSAVAKATKLPVIVYNIKGRTAVNIETPTLMKLVRDNKNIVAVKEASGDMAQIMQVIAEAPKGFSVLSGDDALTFSLMSLGGDGIISVLSNLFPKEMNDLVTAAGQGKWEVARKIHFALLPKMQGCFIGGNPCAIKTAMAQKGLIKANLRLPLAQLSAEEQAKVKAAFK